MTIDARRAALASAREHRDRVAFFNERVFACELAEADLAKLASGDCPELVPDDATCRCGSDEFPEGWRGPGRARCDAFDDEGAIADERHLHRRRSYDPP